MTPFKVEEYQRERVKEVCPATSNREMALLKHMFNMAERWGQHQGTNPGGFVRFLPENNQQFETLTQPSQLEGFAGGKPFRISEGYPKVFTTGKGRRPILDRKSTRLNSSHRCISY